MNVVISPGCLRRGRIPPKFIKNLSAYVVKLLMSTTFLTLTFAHYPVAVLRVAQLWGCGKSSAYGKGRVGYSVVTEL